MDINVSTNQSKGAAVAKEGDNKIGEMTFSIASENMIIIDHTEVDPSQRGQGVGEKLLDKVVAWAREEKKEIIPLCPFAKAQFAKNKDIQDVLKK